MALQGEHLMKMARRMTRSRDQAEELVQDTLLRALTRGHLFEPGTNLLAWLRKMMTNVWRDQLRRRHHRPERDALVLNEALRRGEVDIEGEAVARETARELLVLTLRLTSAQRAMVELVALEDLSYHEAARRLGIKHGAAMQRLYRARRGLAKEEPAE